MNNKEIEDIFNKGKAIGMRKKGASRRQIEQEVGLSRKNQRRLEKSTNNGEQIPLRKKGSGRPKSLNSDDRKKIVDSVKNNQSRSLRSLQKDENINTKGVGLSAIANAVHECGYSSVKKRKKFILSEEHKSSRLEFAQKMIKKSEGYNKRQFLKVKSNQIHQFIKQLKINQNRSKQVQKISEFEINEEESSNENSSEENKSFSDNLYHFE